MSTTVRQFPRKRDLRAAIAAAIPADVQTALNDGAPPEDRFLAGLSALHRQFPGQDFRLFEAVLSAYGQMCLRLGHEPGAAA
jgi:hypothetical protein